MVMDQTYAFSSMSDSLIQTLEITGIGQKQVRYSIQTRIKDAQMMAGELVASYTGIADWGGCFGPVSSDGIMHIDNWIYRSKDGLLTISLYGSDLDTARLEMARIANERMPRK
jgi:hypothetical protein